MGSEMCIRDSAPIVRDPDAAFMGSTMRAAVRALAAAREVAVVSGRARRKVQGFVALSDVT